MAPKPELAVRLEHADFDGEDVKECQKAWGVSETSMNEIRARMVGQVVRNMDGLNEEKLKKAGWRSWKQYLIHSAIRNL